MTTGMKLLFVVLTFVLPFVLGPTIAKALKAKEHAHRLSVALLTLFLGLSPFVWEIAGGGDWTSKFKLGIDLAGGTNLVYQVDREKAEQSGKEVNTQTMDRLVSSVNKRLNPSGTEQITVRQVGSDRLEVIIPGADPEVVSAQKRAMTKLGSLEFAIVANPLDHADIISRAQTSKAVDLRSNGQLEAGWRKVAIDEKTGEEKEAAFGRGATRKDDEGRTEVLLVFGPDQERVTGQYLTNASPGTNTDGSPCVNFRFNSQGATRFFDLTANNGPKRDGSKSLLAVLLDGFVHSAPSINEPISADGQISGSFTMSEINELVGVLNAGALEVPLDQTPVSEYTISPLLGSDIQEKGKTALIWASIAVVVFMALYYLFAGLVADFCLLFNLVLVLGSMVFINATFTLPGLAGLVLTIGMAVDANVLIFERIREEKTKGSSLRMAIHNGFDRAFTTIVDANVTTLLTAIFLYMIGTDQIKGFAVTLFIGIVMSMFTALYVGRTIFEICEQRRLITELKMSQWVKSASWNFVAQQKVTAWLSLVVIVLGLVAFSSRGDENLDIDFTGGTMVSFEFEESHTAGDVKNIILETELGNTITVDELSLRNEEGELQTGNYFRLRTKETDTNKVYNIVNESLTAAEGFNLKKVTMEFDELVAIEKPAEGEPADEFVDGNKTTIKFTSELSPAAAIDGLILSLSEIKNEAGETKYNEVDDLFVVTGTVGSGLDSAKGTVQRYSEVELKSSPDIAKEDLQASLASMQARMAANPTFEEVTSFGSAVASEMQQLAIIAMLASLAAIVIYIWLRFQRLTFGFAAVVALVHDVLIVLGAVAIASMISGSPVGQALMLNDFRINLPMIAAFLTIVGYSLNDTIVVFDRIREVRGKNPTLSAETINVSLNQTLSRTLLTSITTLLVVAILYIWGGEGIHGFAFCLLIGVIAGTYSSIYVASPVLLWLMNRKNLNTAN